MTVSKSQILDLIRSLATENDGRPPGQRALESAGISRSMWRGKFWLTWSQALTDAGFPPNKVDIAVDVQTVISRIALLTRENQRFPTYADRRFAKQRDPQFPGAEAFRRLGGHSQVVERVRSYAISKPEFADVLALLPRVEDAAPTTTEAETDCEGFVYLLQHARHYKIGKTFSVPRRHREIALELPEKPLHIHSIATDDPSGIEAYWHKRFEAKRTNGELFILSADDIRAFKRRKFM